MAFFGSSRSWPSISGTRTTRAENEAARVNMTFLNSWYEFEKSAEKLCLANPSGVRYVMKYNHSKGLVEIKVTDDVKCLQYRTGLQQDLRKIDKFVLNYMRMMV